MFHNPNDPTATNPATNPAINPVPIDLGALIASRICHDLISPLGAISNGLELMAMSGEPPSAEVALITASIEAANAKIRFFRIAYGAAKPGVTLAEGEIRSVLETYFNGARCSAVWLGPRETPRLEARLAFLAVQCLETALPYGGEITVEHHEGRWHMTATGREVRLAPEMWGLLDGKATEGAEFPAAQVQFAMLAEHTAGRRPAPDYEVSDGRIILRI